MHYSLAIVMLWLRLRPTVQLMYSLANSHVCEWPQMVHEQHSRMQFAALELGRGKDEAESVELRPNTVLQQTLILSPNSQKICPIHYNHPSNVMLSS